MRPAATVQALLASGSNPDERDETGATALMYAGAFGTLETVRTLLDGNANVNASATDGATALMWATSDVAKVRLLLDRGATVRATSADDTTAAMAAAQRGDIDSLRLLARIIHEEADYSRKTNAPVWYKGCAHRPFATTEALA